MADLMWWFSCNLKNLCVIVCDHSLIKYVCIRVRIIILEWVLGIPIPRKVDSVKKSRQDS